MKGTRRGAYIDFLSGNRPAERAQFTPEDAAQAYMSTTEYRPFQYIDTGWVEIPPEEVNHIK